MSETIDDFPGIVTSAGTVDAPPLYSHTTIDYGALYDFGGDDLFKNDTDGLSVNIHLEQNLPVREIEATITI